MGSKRTGNYKGRSVIPLYSAQSNKVLKILKDVLPSPEGYEARQMWQDEIGRSQEKILSLSKMALSSERVHLEDTERVLLMEMVEHILGTKTTRTTNINLRITRQEKTRIEGMARAAGFASLAAYIRYLLDREAGPPPAPKGESSEETEADFLAGVDENTY